MKGFLGCVGFPGAAFLGYIGGILVGISLGDRTNWEFEGLPIVTGLIGAVVALVWYWRTTRCS